MSSSDVRLVVSVQAHGFEDKPWEGHLATGVLVEPGTVLVPSAPDGIAEATEGIDLLVLPLPLGVAKRAIDDGPGVDRLRQIPSSAVDYFVHPTRYGTAATTAALAGSGVRCPRFPEYAERLVAFVRAHPEIGSAAMV